jgi:hypothetical protein
LVTHGRRAVLHYLRQLCRCQQAVRRATHLPVRSDPPSCVKSPPVSSRSRAILCPTCQTRMEETSAGTNPMRTSVYPNFASGTARVKSHMVAIPVPPAMAAPFTAAIVGLGKSYSRRKNRAMRPESSTFSACDFPVSDFSSSKSMPAQKALPAPVTIATCASEDSDLSQGRLRPHRASAKLSALRFSGRLNVIVAIRES